MKTKQLFLLVTLLTIAQGAWAQGATVIDGISYQLNSEDMTAEVVKPIDGGHYTGDIVIPDYVEPDGNKYAVTVIGELAFWNAELTSLQLPEETLKVIFDGAFRDASGLTSFDIPESVTTIGITAFTGSDLTHLHIPASVTEMGESAIGGCPDLESVTVAEGNTQFGAFDGVVMDKAQTRLIVYPAKLAGKAYTVPATVTTIDDEAFQYVAFLTSVTIPASVSELKRSMFSNATSLAEINIDTANTAYCSEEGVVYTADMETLIAYPAGKTSKNYTPNTAAKAIGNTAFSHAVYLETVTLPEGITTIGISAFNGCTALQHVSFSESITQIDRNAFCFCSQLESIVLPPHITEVQGAMFFDCEALRSVTIPAEVTSIGMMAFAQCNNLEEITCLATTPPTADGNAFLMLPTDQISLYVPEEAVETYKAADVWKTFDVQPVTKIAHVKIGDLYYNLDLQKKTAQVTWQYYVSLQNYQSLTAATIPASVSYQGQDLSVTDIDEGAFAYCGITEVSIPESMTSISANAFIGCQELTGVAIPNSVERIGEDAFSYCSAITDVTFGSGLKTIARGAFAGCNSITSITIPDNVERIDDAAFELCSTLTTVTIGSGVTSIGTHVFNMCPSLTEIIVSAENPAYCSEEGVLFNKDKTTILKCVPSKTGDYVLPNSVTTIEIVSFMNCQGLTSLTLPDGLVSIGEGAFINCTSLTEITIPNSVTTIGSLAFTSCKGLKTLTIGSGVTTIEDMAFTLCSGLTTIYNYAVTPQVIDAKTFLLASPLCVLYVPEESVDLYKAADVWKNFNIKGISETGIGHIEITDITGKPDAWYTLDGRKIVNGQWPKGIYIYKGKKIIRK